MDSEKQDVYITIQNLTNSPTAPYYISISKPFFCHFSSIFPVFSFANRPRRKSIPQPLDALRPQACATYQEALLPDGISWNLLCKHKARAILIFVFFVFDRKRSLRDPCDNFRYVKYGQRIRK